jgi:hypothetical protein
MSLHDPVLRDVSTRRIQLAAALAAISFLAACSSDSTGVGKQTGSSLAFTAGSSRASSALASTVPITVGSNTLDVSAITVVIDRASLKSTQADSCKVDDDEDDDGDHDRADSSAHHDSGPGGDGDRDGHSHDGLCGEVRVGPTIVDLPVDGSVVTIPGNTVPPGTFREIELRIGLVRLQGTFNSKAFDVTVPVGAKAEMVLDPPVTVVADGSVAITVNLPVDKWLVNADGSLINPDDLRTNLMLLARVRMNIASSIHAFEDRDHDGKPDR